MIVVNVNESFIKQETKSVIGLGYFDGVHLGHQELISKVKSEASRLNVKSAIITFDSSIDKVLFNDNKGEITPLTQRVKLFEEFGLDIVYVIHFDKKVANLDPLEFINILKLMNPVKLVSGIDFRYGLKAKGDVNLLNEYFDNEVINFLNIDNIKISSSNIIRLINEGNIKKANELLGRPYFIESKVIKGLGNGNTSVVPTINMDIEGFVFPKPGVYKTNTCIDGKQYKSISYFGTHPTIDELKNPILETYILDFEDNLYNKIVKVEFLDFIRDSLKFNNVSELKTRIKSDTFFNF